MLRAGRSIRLTEKEIEGLMTLTGARPRVKTIDDLNRFIDVHLRQYPGRFPEELLLRRLLESYRITEDEEQDRLVGAETVYLEARTPGGH